MCPKTYNIFEKRLRQINDLISFKKIGSSSKLKILSWKEYSVCVWPLWFLTPPTEKLNIPIIWLNNCLRKKMVGYTFFMSRMSQNFFTFLEVHFEEEHSQLYAIFLERSSQKMWHRSFEFLLYSKYFFCNSKFWPNKSW